MAASAFPAVLMVSVSAESPMRDSRTAATNARSVEAVFDLLAGRDIAATWRSQSPIRSPLAGRIAQGQTRQEIGLAVSSQARETLAIEVRRETLTARAGGINLSTVFADEALSADRHELLTKYGITAVAEVGQQASAGYVSSNKLWQASRWLLPLAAHVAHRPQNLRWGLWRMPTAMHLATAGAWQVRHAVDSAVATGGTLHLHVDLEATPSRLLGDLESVIRQIDSHASRGRLTTQTMSTVVARLSRPRVVAPACSILRKRAA